LLQFGDGVAIDEPVVGSGGYDVMDSGVRGVLVATKSGRGAVRTVGENENRCENVETKPNAKNAQYYIIVVEEGQSCAVLGKPSYRLIR